MIGRVGPKGIANTLQYAEDGISFSRMSAMQRPPHAAGTYRPEAFTDSGKGKMIQWGVQIGSKRGFLPFLERFDYTWKKGTAILPGGSDDFAE